MPKRMTKTRNFSAAFEPQKFWCGSEESYRHFIRLSENEKLAMDEYDDEDMPPMWEKIGSVGVVNIKGSLIKGDAGWMRAYGFTGYDNIRQALIEAVSDPEVKTIMLDVDSGGGHVAGVSDTGKFLKQIARVKPVTTFSGGTMASAAYWLGSVGGRITVADTAEIGSVGVLVVHQEMSKMLDDVGVKVTVVRAGEYKAIPNRYEPLGEKGANVLQSQVDYLYAPFIEHVAEMRGVSPQEADKKFGQGRVFLGQQAVDAGAVDRVGSYEDALSFALSIGNAANNMNVVRTPVAQATSMPDNGNILNKGSSMPTPTLSAEQLAALAAGVPIADVGLPAPAADTNPDTPNLGAPASDVAPAVDVPAAPEAAAPAADVQGIEFFRNETKAAQLDLVKAEAKAAALAEENEKLKAQAEAMSGIVRQSVGQMSVAMGGTADAGKALAGSDLLAEHTRLADLFKSKFKVGGVVATTPENPEKPKAALVNPLFAALAKSVPAKKE